MSHQISKQNIFNFLKAKSVVIEIASNSNIEIIEEKNIDTSKLQKVNITSLKNSSKYWQLNPETPTFLQPNSKKVESIILEETEDNILNIFLIEMKSGSINRRAENDICEKFSASLSWVYLLLNLLNNKENQKIKVFGILVAQKDMKWNENKDLDIFISTSIRYKKKSFYTPDTQMNISFKELTEEKGNTK